MVKNIFLWTQEKIWKYENKVITRENWEGSESQVF